MTSKSSSTTGHLPHDPLTELPADITPTAEAVRRLRQELYGNAIAVKTTLGGGKHGHLGMIMPEDEYIEISHGAKTFANIQPKVPTLNKTADKRDQQMQQYREQLDAYEKVEDLQDQLRALILQAVPHTYIGKLKDNQTG
jgi:hypothetical protein